MFFESLEDVFKDEFSSSDRACIAVALISEGKAREIDKLSKKHDVYVRLIVGIDMPTPNAALSFLMNAEANNENLRVRYYHEESFFHPKVYLFKKDKKSSAYVGSANYTERGFSSNAELTLQTKNIAECKKINNWFNDLWKNSCSPITAEMIACRTNELAQKHHTPLPDMSKIKKVCKHIENFNQEDIIEKLRVLRRNKTIYEKIRDQRIEAIENLQQNLDAVHNFEGFKGKNIDLFCQDGSLGDLDQHGVREALHAASRKGKLQTFCMALTDENQPIEKRVSRALKELSGIGRGVITKILTTLYPEKYILFNGCSKDYLCLNELSSGKKYVEYCEFGKELLRLLNVENFAILDGLIRQASDNDAI
ncbi:hypothetical protein B7990_11155 [Fibrobacter sp. UWB4]|uniref:phospholipase D family protein n=1 Tax=Fibrobacter sp. UWB4 TaxID=1964356 RepID=UPI000B52153E|nr:phospholipase D family protein [Fibrobacter sp. UWB4]OWV16837.1 hypothetical protein B7990_11155 [Fibrobacter sp. UWB4]